MTQKLESAPAHARLAPSAASQWMACPGSIGLCESMPPDKDGSSFYAEEGTAAHEMAALTLESEEKIASAFVGQASQDAPGFIFDEDMEGFVQKYVDDILQYAHGNEIWVEQRVDVSCVTGVPESFGTADTVILTADGKELQVHDLKYGMGVRVEAKRNAQLMTYGGGALEAYDLMGDVETIKLVIHQPRLHAISEWDCTVAELKEFMAEANEAGKKAEAYANGKVEDIPADAFTPGEKQCRWCNAQAICPSLVKHNLKTVSAEFDDLTDETTETLGKKVTVAIEAMPEHTDEALGKLLGNVDLIEGWCKALRVRANSQLLAGCKIPGFKLVEGRQGDRAWADKDVAEVTLKAMRVKKDEMYTAKLISPTQAEKVLKDSPRRWNTLKKQITRAPGKPHVAPESDKREAINMTPVADGFDDLNEGSVDDLM